MWIRERDESGDATGQKEKGRIYHCTLLLAGAVGALVQGGGTV